MTATVIDKMAEDNDYERILCVKNEVFVFRIPPRTTNRGYRYVIMCRIYILNFILWRNRDSPLFSHEKLFNVF